ncbi:MAG: AAA family ATPase [Pseudomonadales bacterium]
MAMLYLIEGPVGAGKSTHAGRLALAERAVHLNLDEWMVNLFSPDRPSDGFMAWYGERKDRCIEQIWRLTERLMEADVTTVLELGLVQRAAREHFYGRVDAAGFPLSVHVLEAGLETRRQRVRSRNESGNGTFRMVVSDEVFELANGAWEPPDDAECEARGIEWVRTD